MSTVKHICPGKATLSLEPYNFAVSKEGLGPGLCGLYGRTFVNIRRRQGSEIAQAALLRYNLLVFQMSSYQRGFRICGFVAAAQAALSPSHRN